MTPKILNHYENWRYHILGDLLIDRASQTYFYLTTPIRTSQLHQILETTRGQRTKMRRLPLSLYSKLKTYPYTELTLRHKNIKLTIDLKANLIRIETILPVN